MDSLTLFAFVCESKLFKSLV